MPDPTRETPAAAALFAAWRERRDGFAPLFLEPLMSPALAHLAPAIRPGAVVLDLGSGGGHVADAIRDCGARTICLEIETAVLAESRRRYCGGEHVAADAARLPLADGSVDAIFCFSVLQYADRDRALAEMRRVLKRDGRVVVAENLAGSPTAMAYRAWRWLVGIRYPARLNPRHHVHWSQRSRFLEPFPGARLDAFYLFSTWLLLIPAVYNSTASEEPGSLVRSILGAAGRFDSLLLRTLPPLRHGAWMLLLRG